MLARSERSMVEGRFFTVGRGGSESLSSVRRFGRTEPAEEDEEREIGRWGQEEGRREGETEQNEEKGRR